MNDSKPMSPAELLALAAEVCGRDDGSIVFPSGHYVKNVTAEQPVCRTSDMVRDEESRAIRYLERFQKDLEEAANAERVLRRLQREKAEEAAAAERERLDPLHVLEAPREPVSPSDGVYLYRCGGLPFGVEFRRPSDGRRYSYRAPRGELGALREVTPEAACLPAEDAEALAALGHPPTAKGSDFSDLLGMVESWHAPRFPDRSARNYYPPHDFATSIALSDDPAMIPTIARWGRYALKSALPGRSDLAWAIRQHLARAGFLESMIPFEQLDKPSPFPAGMTKKYAPDPLPQSTMATKEWAQTGVRR